MKKINLIFILFLSLNSFAQKTISNSNKEKAKKMDLIIGKYHNYNLFNGSALVVQNGKVILQKNYGKADKSWNIDAASDTKFRIGSVTKQFTGMLIMQLKQEGKIKLDDKISDYLPWFSITVGSKITIHQLLTHTSGLPNYTDFPDFKTKMVFENLPAKDV